MGNDSQKDGPLLYSCLYGQHLLLPASIIQRPSANRISASNYVVCKHYTLHSKQEQLSFVSLLKQYSSIDTPTIIKMLGYQQLTNSDHEGQYQYEVFYEHHPQSLRQQQPTNKQYTEEQLLQLIDCLLSGIIVFQYFRLPLSKLSPEKIVINSNCDCTEGTVYAIGLDLLLNPNENGAKESANYKSPEQNDPQGMFTAKSLVYVIGIIVMETALGVAADNTNLQRQIFTMREKYSPHFATILTEMLTKGQNMRPGIEKVYEMIKPSLQSLDSSFKCSGRDTLSKKILKKGYNCVENHELYQAKHASQAAIDSWNSLLARIKNTAT